MGNFDHKSPAYAAHQPTDQPRHYGFQAFMIKRPVYRTTLTGGWCKLYYSWLHFGYPISVQCRARATLKADSSTSNIRKCPTFRLTLLGLDPAFQKSVSADPSAGEPLESVPTSSDVPPHAEIFGIDAPGAPRGPSRGRQCRPPARPRRCRPLARPKDFLQAKILAGVAISDTQGPSPPSSHSRALSLSRCLDATLLLPGLD